MRIFFLVLLGITLWQFLPEYVWPMLGSLAFLCWVAPNNSTANFLGAGFGGAGMLNLSLDWSSISANINLFLTPWWTQVIMFVSFVLSCWILLPAAKYGGMGSWDVNLMSNRLFLGKCSCWLREIRSKAKHLAENGTAYPITQLLTADVSFNETAYEEFGPPYASTHFLWTVFFDYASYTSAIVWMALFGYGQVKSSVRKLWERRKTGASKISEQFDDQLCILQRSYSEVPLWWYITLFGASFAILLSITASGVLFIPAWTFIVAILTGAILVVPLGWLYALSNFQLVSVWCVRL
jgi:hypothetical protein